MVVSFHVSNETTINLKYLILTLQLSCSGVREPTTGAVALLSAVRWWMKERCGHATG